MTHRFPARVLMLPAALLLAGLLLMAAPGPLVRAATVAVNSVPDEVHAGPSGCATTGVGTCSLRDAVLYANANANTIITLPAGTYVLTIPPDGSFNPSIGALKLTNTVGTTTISGAGSATTIIDGNAADRLLYILRGTVSISGITLRNGHLENAPVGGILGGAINNFGALTVRDCVFANNSVVGVSGTPTFRDGQDGRGGAIANNSPTGSLTIYNSTFTMNSATGGQGATGAVSSTGGNGAPGSGGAIYSGSTLTVIGSTFVSNRAIGGAGGLGGPDLGLGGGNGGDGNNGFGGAIYLVSAGVLHNTVTNSTFTGNSATGGGGGDGAPGVGGAGVGGRGGQGVGGAIFNNGPNAIINVTIAANSAVGGLGGGSGANGLAYGGGIYAQSPLQITNTIIANNTAGGNCFNPITDNGHNLEFPTTTCGFTTGAPRFDQLGDPLLGSLASNGGPTQTLALLPGSAAIDTGDDAACAAPLVGNVDQRGGTRPRGAHCDIGAFEAGFVLTSLNPAYGPPAGGNTVTLTGADFTVGATVSFGGTAATVTNVTPTAITVTAPAHAMAQAVDVVVTSGGFTVTLTGGYAYGSINPLPGRGPTGGAGGNPSPLPPARQSGGMSGIPNPLPPSRP